LRLRLAHVFLGALLGALALYLDFGNLLMMLLKWFSQRQPD
jgi:FtsH-binding integral membrane protein